MFTIPMTNFNRLRSPINARDMFAVVFEIEGRKYFRTGSASGPLEPGFYDLGPVRKGDVVSLAYNYAKDDYASRTGWDCEVIRINRKTITVQAWNSDKGAHGSSYRVEVIL